MDKVLVSLQTTVSENIWHFLMKNVPSFYTRYMHHQHSLLKHCFYGKYCSLIEMSNKFGISL